MSRTSPVTRGTATRLGPVPAGVNQNIYQESSEPKCKVGTRLDLNDGRVFYYCKNGAVALAAGKLVGSPAVATEKETNMSAAVAIGEKKIPWVSVGTTTADQYAEGWFYVCKDTGAGQTYKIQGNEAIAAAATGYITLYDGLVVALDTTSDCIIVPTIFTGLTLNPDVVRKTIGVPLIAVTASYYFWCQTWGPAAVLCGDSTGNAATERWCHPATSTGEFVTTAGGVAGTEIIGDQIFDSTDMVDAEYHLIYLKCIL